MKYTDEMFSDEKTGIDVFLERVKLIRTVARRELIERLEITLELRSEIDVLLLKMEAEDDEIFR